MRWERFGRWPSTHDLDLYLDADAATYARLELLAGQPGDAPVTVPIEVLPCANELRRIGTEHGVPLDLFLVPTPGDLSVAAWIEPPYTFAVIDWRGTFDRSFFEPERKTGAPWERQTGFPSTLLEVGKTL